MEFARQAVALAPNDRDGRYALALVLDAKGRAPEALIEAGRAVALGAGADARLLQASLAMRTGDVALAQRATDETLRVAPNDARALYNLGLLEQRRGHYNAAREAYLRALRADPTSYGARYNLAAMTNAAGATDEARHHATLLLRAHPGDRRATELLQSVNRPSEGTH